MDRGQSPQHDAAHGFYKEMLISDGHFDCCVIVSEDRGKFASQNIGVSEYL